MKRHNVLVVVDAQNDFITGSLANPVANERVPVIADIIRDYDWDLIVTTYDTHQPDYLKTKEGEKLPVPHCIYMEHGWQLDDRIIDALETVFKRENGPQQISVYKPTFGSEDLVDHIWDCCEFMPADEVNIVICGFCTDICVVSNALILKANFYHFGDIKVVANACAGVTPESHEAALTTMRMCQIDVVETL
jgi:nicotinamidase-related amidase